LDASDPFPAIAFQSTLSTGAILFGVFGFVYTIYATFSSPDEPDDLIRPPIVNSLRLWCRIIAILSLINSFVTFYSLFLMRLVGNNNVVVALILAAIVVATALISSWMAFKAMP
jgi:hypothetical protein